MPSILNATTTNGLVTSADNSGSLQLQTNNGTTAVTIDTSQNVGIGTTSPTDSAGFNRVLDIQSTNGAGVYLRASGSSPSTSYFVLGYSTSAAWLYSTANLPMLFYTNGSERMRITSGGDVYCGQSSYTFGVNPTTGTDIVAGGLIINATRRTTGASGNTLWDSAGVFYRSTSSLKYKRDVETMQYGLNEVMSLRPVTFASKSEVDGDNRFGGFIAEEVDALGLKEFVSYDQENAPDGLQYANMVALLTKAIQELKAELDATKAEVQALKEGKQ